METFIMLCFVAFAYKFYKGMVAEDKANKEALLNDNLKETKDFTSKIMRKGQAEVIARNIKANYKTIHSQAKPAKKKQSIHDKIAVEEMIQKKLMKLFREGMPKHQFQIQKEQSDKRLLNLKQQLKGV